MRKMLGLAAVALLLPLPARAQVQVLDFEGIGDFDPIGNTYPGVSFFGNAVALEQVGFNVTDPCQGSSGFPTAPSGCGVLFYYTNQLGSNAGINVASGFSNGFSFFYYAKYATGNPASFGVYSGLNGTGTLLGSGGLPYYGFGQGTNTWGPAGFGFLGTAQSVVFTNAGGSLIFDNVTLGSGTPADAAPPPPGGDGGDGAVAPEPASFVLLGTGLGALALGVRRRRCA